MWALPITKDLGYTLILLDTEGYDEDPGKSQINFWIFGLPLLSFSEKLSVIFY